MKEKLLAAGGALSALAASACCIAPLVLVSAGVSGAWIGSLTALAPYQPYFIGVALACIGAGFWLVHRRAGAACSATSSRGIARLARNALWMKAALWAGTALVALAVGVDYGAFLLL